MRISGPLCVSIVLLSSGPQATVSAQDFQILEPAEITQHQQTLARLQGEKREAYRTRVYADLVQRARAQGYAMPAVPPWQQQAGAPAHFRPQSPDKAKAGMVAVTNPEAGAAPSRTAPAQLGQLPDEPDMPTLVARQKRVIEEAVQQQLNDDREAAQQDPEAALSGAPAAPANLYREKMRKRFDDFMARREARQRQAEGERQAPQPKPGTRPSVTDPGRPTQPPVTMQAPPFAMPPAPWARPPVPVYPQPAYPAPQPYYPQPPAPQATQPPAYPQPGPPGMPPFGYPPPQAPGWY